MAADLTRAGEDIANDADYDVNEGKKAMLDGKLSVNQQVMPVAFEGYNNFILTGNLHDRRYILETRGNKRVRMTAPVSSSTNINKLTVCYWLQDNYASLSMMYTSANDTMETPAFSLYQNSTSLRLSVKENIM